MACHRNPRDATARIPPTIIASGRLVVLEHVAAPRGSWTRRAQGLVAPFSQWLDHGCDPARDTEAALVRSSLTVIELERVDVRGPFGTTLPHLVATARRPETPASS